jgi:hypothetical protein
MMAVQFASAGINTAPVCLFPCMQIFLDTNTIAPRRCQKVILPLRSRKYAGVILEAGEEL